MKNYHVHWCDIHNTCGGCLDVVAKDKREAVKVAQRKLNLGCLFYLVGVEEAKHTVKGV